MSSHVAVIDYGMGNLHSVAKALEHAGARQVDVTSDPQVILAADRVLLPGVGAIRDCVSELRQLELDGVVRQAAKEKPLLGYVSACRCCWSTAKRTTALTALACSRARCVFFGNELKEADGTRLKVPHMGWNQVKQTIDHPLWHRIEQDARFYFVHSYYAAPDKSGQLAGRCHYGVDFAAALAQDNVFATQFHPEKSHTNGLQLLSNFLAWDGRW
ncbi:imidazole glycerol phosphate synthase subunit HisH [Halopseudomonas pachastrellae]|nr:imidazole glycerol phosphate synthase subunit HisH [Halopseudomonas pachastrellae]